MAGYHVFFLLNADRAVLFQTRSDFPSYLVPPTENWGVLSRMDGQTGCVEEFIPHSDREWDYVVGQAIRPAPQSAADAETVEGYAVFVVSMRELEKRLQTGEKMHFVIVNREGAHPFQHDHFPRSRLL